MNMYIDGNEKREKKRLLTAGSTIIWIVMVGLALFIASQSLVVAG